MQSGMSFKQWLSSSFDLKKCPMVIFWGSIVMVILEFLSWRLMFIAAFIAGVFLILLWTRSGEEKGPECNIYSVFMIITSCILVTAVATLFYWGRCAILSGFELFFKGREYSIREFALVVAFCLALGVLSGIPILLDLRNKARKMPRAIGNPCGISQRIIQKGDRCFWLPTFPCDPQDPLSKYSGACVLRDEFEKWELREELVRKIRETREQALSDSKSLKACPILFHDNTYLIIKARGSKKIEIIFWQHLFALDIPQGEWRNFYSQMLSLVDEIALDPNAIKEQEEKVKISGNAWGAGDCIELSLQEWKHLLDALKAAHEVRRTRWGHPCNGAK